MAMGKRRRRARQPSMWVASADLPRGGGHPFYERLNGVLDEAGFDTLVERECATFYADGVGRPSLAPGRYLRMLLLGYVEGLDSERAIVWRAADSLSLRQFLDIALHEASPDHSTVSRTRRRIDLETHQAVFTWVLQRLADAGLVRGTTVGIDATTLEANAALRSIVRRDTGDGYETFLRGLTIAPENRCSPYNADDYSYPQSVEDDIVRNLGGIYSPYTCESFDSDTQTDIEHIVARSEAHDSGLCRADAGTRRQFARDLLNLTLASPSLNRSQKSDKDAAEWMPEQNRCWFAQTIVDVRLMYGLTIDQREADAIDRMLAGCTSTAISCSNITRPPAADHPPVQADQNCTALREAGWNRGVNRNGGTYRDSWDDAERRTYNLNMSSDRDNDGHACE